VRVVHCDMAWKVPLHTCLYDGGKKTYWKFRITPLRFGAPTPDGSMMSGSITFSNVPPEIKNVTLSNMRSGAFFSKAAHWPVRSIQTIQWLHTGREVDSVAITMDCKAEALSHQVASLVPNPAGENSFSWEIPEDIDRTSKAWNLTVAPICGEGEKFSPGKSANIYIVDPEPEAALSSEVSEPLSVGLAARGAFRLPDADGTEARQVQPQFSPASEDDPPAEITHEMASTQYASVGGGEEEDQDTKESARKKKWLEGL